MYRCTPDHAMDNEPEYMKAVLNFILDTLEDFEKELWSEGKTNQSRIIYIYIYILFRRIDIQKKRKKNNENFVAVTVLLYFFFAKL